MDYLPGGSLRNLIQRRGAFTEEQAKLFVAEALSDLAAIHDKLIIYRDLKVINTPRINSHFRNSRTTYYLIVKAMHISVILGQRSN